MSQDIPLWKCVVLCFGVFVGQKYVYPRLSKLLSKEVGIEDGEKDDKEDDEVDDDDDDDDDDEYEVDYRINDDYSVVSGPCKLVGRCKWT